MRVAFNPNSVKYQKQTVFQGLPYQRGGGIGNVFRGLLRILLPVAKTAGKALGKQALRTGAAIASDIAEGRDIKESATTRGAEALSTMVKKATRKKRGKQKGRGLGTRKAPSKGIKGRTLWQGRKPVKKRKKQFDSLGIYYK